jgi:hypothetical protein
MRGLGGEWTGKRMGKPVRHNAPLSGERVALPRFKSGCVD